MTAPRRLLAATDFSANGDQAVARAARLAAQAGSELLLLHAISDSILANLARMLRDGLEPARAHAEATARDALHERAQALAQQHRLQPQAHTAFGAVAEAIIGIADRQHCDLVVLGARGSNPVRDFLLGSNAERTLRKSLHSLLIVRLPPEQEYRNVLVPTDFSAHSLHALQLACTLAPAARLTVLHVCDAPFEGKLEYAGVPAADIAHYREQERQRAAREMEAFLRELPAADRQRITPHVAIGYPAGAILQMATDLGIDLIALGKHGRSPVEEWVLGSVTIHAINHARCDVLAADRRSATSD